MFSDRLYELAFEYKKAKLWNVIWSNLFFAVKLSDNRTGYVRVTGTGSEICALELYVGEEGFASLKRMVKAESSMMGPDEYREVVYQQDCLQLSLMGKDALFEEEREEVKAFARSHGIRISGKNAYPRFLKYQPYYCPYGVLTEEEQRQLCEALEAVIEISKLLKGKTAKELGLGEAEYDIEEVLLMERHDGVYSLGKTKLPPDREVEWPAPEAANDISIAKIKKFKKSGIWECGFVLYEEPVQSEDEEIPLFPIILFAVNTDSDYLLPLPPVVHYQEKPEELLNMFMEVLLDEKFCPLEIRVQDGRTHAFFQSFCEKLNVRLVEEDFLPCFQSVKSEFYEDFCGDEDDSLENISETLDMLLRLDSRQLEQMPGEIRNMFQFLSEQNGLPDDIKDKIDGLLNSMEMEEQNRRPKLEVVGKKLAKEAEGKSYIISVSLGAGCYRHIQISCNALLLDLHSAIIDAFEFDDDHAHAFFMDNKIWSDSDCYYMREAADFGSHTTDRFRLSQAGLEKGMKFKYLFDFGDEWRFQCKVLQVKEEDTEVPVVVKSKGEAPEQYPDWDDWEDD